MPMKFHMGGFGKLGCCSAMGDKDKDSSEIRATKWGLQILNTSNKKRLL